MTQRSHQRMNKLFKSPLFYIALIFLAVIVVSYGMGWQRYFTPEQIRVFVLSFGAFAPVAFIILFSLTPFAPFFSAVLALASGLIFGFFYGSVLIMIGASCSSTIGFYLARYFGAWLKKRNQHQSIALEKLEKSFSDNGFIVIFILRLLPIAPFDLISYAAGFSKIRYRDYIIATVIGMFPGVLIYANIGDSAINIHSKGFYISIALLLLLTVIVLGVKNTIQKRFSIHFRHKGVETEIK